MPTNDDDFDFLSPRDVMRVNSSPLQRGSGDTLLRTATVGGPEIEGDRRMYLSVALLSRLLDIARQSPMQRVQIDRAGTRVDLYVTPRGHKWENWTMIGANPRPEPMPEFMSDAVEASRHDRERG